MRKRHSSRMHGVAVSNPITLIFYTKQIISAPKFCVPPPQIPTTAQPNCKCCPASLSWYCRFRAKNATDAVKYGPGPIHDPEIARARVTRDFRVTEICCRDSLTRCFEDDPDRLPTGRVCSLALRRSTRLGLIRTH